jgi:signal transduction histidine kinase
VLVDSARSAQRGDDYSTRPELAAALTGRADQVKRRSTTLGTDLLATAVPILHGARPIGAVRITQDVASVNRAVRRTTLGLFLLGGVVLVLGLGAGVVIAAQVARPLHRLDEAARRVAEGDLRARAKVEGSSEQRSLARTFNDMTERIGRLLSSQREFIADASHQLRTPLAGLRLRIEEAHAESSEPEVRAELEGGMAEVDRLAEMVAELLVLSEAGERELPGEVVDLNDAADAAAERFAPIAAERSQRVVAQPGGIPAPVWCAPRDLDRALDVLIENAMRYSPEGTTIGVRSAIGSIEVSDEGPGLAPGEAEAVFDRFHRGSAGRHGPPGTGLGLSIARELVRRWGGDVTLANGADRGAVALVVLPPGAPSTWSDAE